MGKMPGQLKPVPMTPKQSRLPRLDVGHHRVVDSPRFQPLEHLRQKFPRGVYVLEKIERGNDVKSVRQERRCDRVAHEYVSSGVRSGPLRRGLLHIDSIKLPGRSLHRAQKCSGRAANIENRSALLILANSSPRMFPPARDIPLAPRHDALVVVLRIVKPHFFRLGRTGEPNPCARRAAIQSIPLLTQMESIRRHEQLSYLSAAAQRTRLRLCSISDDRRICSVQNCYFIIHLFVSSLGVAPAPRIAKKLLVGCFQRRARQPCLTRARMNYRSQELPRLCSTQESTQKKCWH